MSEPQTFLDPRTLAKLEGLSVRARRVVEGFVAGAHRSPLHGFSIEFAQHREYSPGDDLRYLDWKAYGRSDKFYLKQFEEETNLVCHLVLDASESMCYRGPESPMSKLDYARCAAAALTYLVIRQQDSAGLVTFDEAIGTVVRPGSGPSHFNNVVQALEQVTPRPKTSVGAIFHELADRFKQRGLIIVLSDLFDDVEAMLGGLKHLKHRRHDVIVMHVLDPAELEFPFRQTTMFRGLERLPDVLADPLTLRKAYLAEFEQYRRHVESGCRQRQFDYVLLRTDQSLAVVLASYLAARTARVRA